MLQQRSALQSTRQALPALNPDAQRLTASAFCSASITARTAKQQLVRGRGELQITASLIKRDDVHTGSFTH